MNTSNFKKKQRAVLMATVFDTVNIFLRDHVSALKDVGYEVHVIVSPDPRCAEFQEKFGISVHQIEMTRGISPLRDIFSLVRVVLLMCSIRPKLLHFHTPKASLIGSIAGILSFVSIRIFTLHGSVGLGEKGMKGRLLRFFDWMTCTLSTSVWCVSPSLRSEICSRRICNITKTVVLGAGSVCGVDLEKFNRDANVEHAAKEIRRNVVIGDGAVIGFVGRINSDKGILDLMHAFSDLQQSDPSLSLLIVGDFDETAPLTFEQKRCLTDMANVSVVGFQADVVPLISAMDLLVLPSYREGFGMVCIEAGALEIPVVGTRINGLKDAIADGKTGVLVAAGDVAALKESIRALLSNTNEAKRLGKEGRRRVETLFSRDRVSKLVFQQYLLESGV